MDGDLKRYADSLYEAARMDSARVAREERVKTAQIRAGLNRADLPLSGPDIRAMLDVFEAHVARCVIARFESYETAYSEASRTPSEQDFTDILDECKAVKDLEVAHAIRAMREFIGSRAMVGVPNPNVQMMVETGSAHGHDRVMQKWKIWRARVQLKPAIAGFPVPEKRLDALLQTYDRAEFNLDLDRMVSNASESSPAGLVFLDVDKFKSINDGPGGHEAGDRALKAFSEAVLRVCKGKGNTYRFGGDELCILLPNHSLNECMAVAERVRREVRAIRTPELPDGLSSSLGVACFPESCADGSRLLSQADNAMYVSKSAGGDRVSKNATSS